jgi:AraC family transcriptional activator of pobA
MPNDPNSIEAIKVSPLSGLYPNGSWEIELAHDRDTHLLIWITRGQGRVLLDGTRRGFGPHNALFIPAGGLMALEFGRGCLGQVMRVPASNAMALPHRPQHLRIVDLNAQSSLTIILDAMQREQTQQATMWHRAMQSHGELVGILLRRQSQRDAPGEQKRSAAHRLTQAYCARISKLHRNNITMSDHAADLGVTPTHLTRVVKAETGTTAAGLLTERQLYAARRMLIETNMPIQEIASQLNFSSAAYFTRFITQHSGQTPRALRKQARA